MTAHRAIITGASSGVGLAVARNVHRHGGTVALLARKPDRLNEIVDAFGDRAFAFPTDVADPNSVAVSIEKAHNALEVIDLVVNSAGTCAPVELAALDAQRWQDTIAVNLSGSFYVARQAAPLMSSGSIVNVASELSTIGMAGFVDYCAAKSGVIGLTKALAAELAPRGIRVNAVCPGPIDTPMLAGEFELFDDPAAVRTDAIERIPLKRFATADEIAEAILYLHSAQFATGACLSVDGGTTVV
ncbi:SDR family oxidoreductase [Mycobacterium sp. DSM 3803]|nr:SDR family oxidoreductase [Mycobacterium sp. DSM 3803]